LDFLKDENDSMIQSSYDPKLHFDKEIADTLDEIMKEKNVTQAEALDILVKGEWDKFLEGQEKMEKLCKGRGIPITREDYKKKKGVFVA